MQTFFRTIRELVATFNEFESLSAKHVRTLGLTPGQFDVIATLGNQPPMTCKDLAERTLMVKGNLTVVLDGLIKKEFITRKDNPYDGRSFLIELTPEGDSLFQKIFPIHLEYLKPLAESLNDANLHLLQDSLRGLRKNIKEYQQLTTKHLS